MLTAPPTSSAAVGTSPSQANDTARATTGTRYSTDVAAETVDRATAYPQVTKPSADGSSPSRTTDTVAGGGADATSRSADGASGTRRSVPLHIA
jgi:hypothetical protein